MTDTNETWKAIAGYEGMYEVSDDGRVRSLDRIDSSGKRRKGVLMQGHIMKIGYRQVILRKNDIPYTAFVHTLVLEAFVGPRPHKFDACHNNGIRSDNRLENLRWDSRSGNMADRIKHGTTKNGELSPNAKLKESQVREIFDLRKTGMSQTDIAVLFGVSRAHIGAILSRKWWAHLNMEAA